MLDLGITFCGGISERAVFIAFAIPLVTVLVCGFEQGLFPGVYVGFVL